MPGAIRTVDASREKLPRATHAGELKIGTTTTSCAVLEGGVRVIGRDAMLMAIGRTGVPHGKQGESIADDLPVTGTSQLPIFLAAENLKPYVSQHIGSPSWNPVKYRTLAGQSAAPASRRSNKLLLGRRV